MGKGLEWSEKRKVDSGKVELESYTAQALFEARCAGEHQAQWELRLHKDLKLRPVVRSPCKHFF